MKALLIGASGLTGSLCLKQLIENPIFTSIEIWLRKKLNTDHPKVLEKVIDFKKIAEQFPLDIDILFCCLGSTIKKSGSQEKFREIDYTYVLELARQAEKTNIKKFVVISSIGANSISKSFYLRTKGEMEKEVFKLNIPTIIILRPSLILGNRSEFRFGEKMAKFIMNSLSFLFIGKLKRYKGIEAETIAKAMIAISLKDIQGKLIIESEQIKQFANS